MISKSMKKWVISGAVMTITVLFFFLTVNFRTPDLSMSFLMCILPSVIGCAVLLYLSGIDNSPVPCTVVLIFNFLLSAGNAFQVVLGVNEASKIFMVNAIALVGASLALTGYIAVIKKKVLITRRGYRIAIYVTAATILTLFIVLLLFGSNIGGAKLWLRIGSQTIEISEIIKLLFFILLALIYNSNMNVRNKILYGAVALFVSSVFLALLNEFGTVIMLSCVYIIIFFIHVRTRFSLLMLCAFAVILAIALAIIFGTHECFKDASGFFAEKLNKIYDRLTREETDQMTRSLQGMINGGIFGCDLSYVIDVFSIEADFALSGLAQYFGILMMIVCVLSVAAVVYLVYHKGTDDEINNRSRYKLSYIFTIAIAVQSILCLCSNIGLPCVGLGMPAISAGGTQMLTLYIEIAFIVYGLLDEKAAAYHIVEPAQCKINEGDYYVED